MSRRGAILAGGTALAMLASGAVVASALNDLPQDAVPVQQDPTSVLNRQPTPPPVPVEPAPEATPAPAAPVAVAPPAPTIVVAPLETAEADVEEEAEEEAAVTPAAVQPETPATPARRQRGRFAVIDAIDKITAESMRFEVEVGGRPVAFRKTLIFTARACEVSAGDELVSDAIAYLEVGLQPRGLLQINEPRQIFRGWMFASSPAVNGLEHPIYDAWVVGCRA
jgi:hypothetical protein